jgi:hypothetical protein
MLRDEKMDEYKFWGFVLNEDDEFDYGRDLLKEDTYEQLLQLPYNDIDLFYQEWFGANFEIHE